MRKTANQRDQSYGWLLSAVMPVGGACSGKGLISAVSHSNCLRLKAWVSRAMSLPSDGRHPWTWRGNRGSRLKGQVAQSPVWRTACDLCGSSAGLLSPTTSTLLNQYQFTSWRKHPSSLFIWFLCFWVGAIKPITNEQTLGIDCKCCTL